MFAHAVHPEASKGDTDADSMVVHIQPLCAQRLMAVYCLYLAQTVDLYAEKRRLRWWRSDG